MAASLLLEQAEKELPKLRVLFFFHGPEEEKMEVKIKIKAKTKKRESGIVLAVKVELAPPVFQPAAKAPRSCRCASFMEDRSLGEIDELPSQLPHPPAEVDILKIQKKVFIKISGFFQSGAAHEEAGGAQPVDLPLSPRSLEPQSEVKVFKIFLKELRDKAHLFPERDLVDIRLPE
jgi:hypothetical protein